ncbi:MAG: putative lipid II flippase FtsW [Oscillospiraceae bacterium]|nr:putative lipid II flippase FtsW [Oscillospiraceae bacterium]
MDYSDNRIADYRGDSSIRRGAMDVPFLLLTLLLLTIGVVMVLSASFARAYYAGASATYYFTRQLFFAVSGVAIMIVASRFPIGFYRRFSTIILLFSLVLLALVLIGGENSGGATRWFTIGGITFQPSEIAKAAVILFDAGLVCRYKNRMGSFRYGVLPFVIVAGLVVGLLILEPHLSGSIIILLVTATIMFLGGTRLFWFILGGGGVLLGGVVVINILAYSSERISAWRDPFADTGDTGYQIVQSLYAIGSGGLTGLGLGNSRQKYLYLPEEHNDFIFSVVCEELGFIGASLILLLFALLIIRGFYLAMHCRDRYSFLVCAGFTALLAFQVILNVGVVTNLLPCTGISLPFFSYGGTALWLQLAEMGIILSISRDIPEKKFVRERGKKTKRAVREGAQT